MGREAATRLFSSRRGAWRGRRSRRGDALRRVVATSELRRPIGGPQRRDHALRRDAFGFFTAQRRHRGPGPRARRTGGRAGSARHGSRSGTSFDHSICRKAASGFHASLAALERPATASARPKAGRAGQGAPPSSRRTSCRVSTLRLAGRRVSGGRVAVRRYPGRARRAPTQAAVGHRNRSASSAAPGDPSGSYRAARAGCISARAAFRGSRGSGCTPRCDGRTPTRGSVRRQTQTGTGASRASLAGGIGRSRAATSGRRVRCDAGRTLGAERNTCSEPAGSSARSHGSTGPAGLAGR